MLHEVLRIDVAERVAKDYVEMAANAVSVSG
jgi:hypothetical protein